MNAFKIQNPNGILCRVSQTRLTAAAVLVAVLISNAIVASPCRGQDDGSVAKPMEKPAMNKTQAMEEPQAKDLSQRAWEYRPYNVAVWICTDGDPLLNSVEQELIAGITRRSELLDPSGWFLNVGNAPSDWRYRFLKHIETPEGKCEQVAELPVLKNTDKLMIVTMQCEHGATHLKVRELDLKTQQWGPMLSRTERQIHQLDASVIDMISVAFMPIAKINRITEKDEVFISARAMYSCVRSQHNEDGEMVVAAIEDSPVWVKNTDRMLPIIRRTDKNGDLVKLEPIPYTFLSIETQNGPKLTASIKSYRRFALGTRSSKLAEKLALVIRAPDRSTMLHVLSFDEEPVPMEGIEIWSRFPKQSKDVESEFLGKTDWQGRLPIPPSPEGLRILYPRRGDRRFSQLPMMPGLRKDLTTQINDDQTRLYAEGIIQGMNTEILNLVAQREIYESEISTAINKKNLDEAKDVFKRYQDLETPQDIKGRLTDEEARLKSETTDTRELNYIKNKFATLRSILDGKLVESKELRLLDRLNRIERGEPDLPPEKDDEEEEEGIVEDLPPPPSDAG